MIASHLCLNVLLQLAFLTASVTSESFQFTVSEVLGALAAHRPRTLYVYDYVSLFSCAVYKILAFWII